MKLAFPVVLLLPAFAQAQILLPNGEPDPSFSDLYAWYDAASGVNGNPLPEPDGTPLASWSDRSINLRDLTRVDTDITRLPTAADNSASCGPAVRFDGDDYIWASTTDTFGTLTGARTFFVVVEVDQADRGYVFDGSTNSGRSTLHAGESANPDSWHYFMGDNTAPAPNGSLTLGSNVVDSRYLIHSLVLAPGQQEHYINFLLESNSTHPDVFQLGGFILGARVNTQLGMSGHVKEVLIYSDTLSDVDRQLIEGYLTLRHDYAYGEAYGEGCAGTNGRVPRLRTVGCPGLGESFTMELSNAALSSPAALLFGIGQGAVPPGGCTVLLNVVAFPVNGSTNQFGRFEVPLSIPANGTPFAINCQGFIIDPAATPFGVAVSNGVELNVF